MIHLDLFGKKSSRYEFLKGLLFDRLDHVDLDVSFREHQDIHKFLESNVLSIPAIRINNQPIMDCREGENLNEFTNDVMKEVLNAKTNHANEILVPIYFSEASINAVAVAVELANLYESQIRLLHVYHPKAVEVNNPILEMDKITSQLDEKLDTICMKCRKSYPNQEFVHEVVVGFAEECILTKSELPSTQFVVMGSQGENSKLKKWIGSVSLSVCQKASCPVFLVPDGFKRPLHNYLFCSKDIKYDDYSLKLVQKLAHKNDGVVETITVNRTEGPISDLIFEEAGNHNSDVIALTKRKRSFWSQLREPSATAEISSQLQNCVLLVLHL